MPRNGCCTRTAEGAVDLFLRRLLVVSFLPALAGFLGSFLHFLAGLLRCFLSLVCDFVGSLTGFSRRFVGFFARTGAKTECNHCNGQQNASSHHTPTALFDAAAAKYVSSDCVT